MKQKINRALTIAAMVLSFFLILALTKFIPSMVLSVFADHDVSQTDAVSPSEPNDPVIPYVNRINVLENPMKPMARGILTHVTSSGASITVAKLFEELGVSQSADDVTGIDCNSRFFDTNTGTGGSRVIQTTRSFDSLETLTFQFSDGSTLPIIFKDSLYVTNIAPLCTDVSIIINGKNYSSNSTESYDEPVAVNGRKNYELQISFAELPDKQFSDYEQLEYQLPDAFTLPDNFNDMNHTFNIEMALGARLVGNKVTYDKSTNRIFIDWNRDDENAFDTFRGAGTAKFTLVLGGNIDPTKGTLILSADKKLTLEHENLHNVSVEKTALYAPYKINYEIKLTSDGTNENLTLTDEMGIAIQNPETISFSFEDDNHLNDPAYTPTVVSNENGTFIVNIPKLDDADVLYIRYLSDIDVEKIARSANATVEETGNTAKIVGDSDPSDNVASAWVQGVDFSDIEKNVLESKNVFRENHPYTDITWQVITNRNALIKLSGSSLTDVMSEEAIKYSRYSGEGITVMCYDKNGDIAAVRSIPWEDLGVDIATATSFTYHIPDTDPPYMYEMVYKTSSDTAGLTKQTYISNTVTGKCGTEETGQLLKPPYGGLIAVSKKATNIRSDRVTWEIKNVDKFRKPNGQYYNFYSVDYFLVPCDAEALARIEQLVATRNKSLINGDYPPSENPNEPKTITPYTVTNTASFRGTSTTANVNLPHKNKIFPVDKSYSRLNKDNSEYGLKHPTYKFEININPGRGTLNNGDPMAMTDTYSSSLSVNYRSIKITTYPPGKESDVTYDYSKNKGTFVIPDNTYINITYEAQITEAAEEGKDYVPFSNTVEVNGLSATVEDNAEVSVKSLGDAITPQIFIYKYCSNHMELGLNGAVFGLYEAETDEYGNELTDENGNRTYKPIVVHNEPFTMTSAHDSETGKDGQIHLILDMQVNGFNLAANKYYYIHEESAPENYIASTTWYQFMIRTDGQVNYSQREYLLGDTLTVRNSPKNVTVKLEKVITGNVNLFNKDIDLLSFKVEKYDDETEEWVDYDDYATIEYKDMLPDNSSERDPAGGDPSGGDPAGGDPDNGDKVIDDTKKTGNILIKGLLPGKYRISEIGNNNILANHRGAAVSTSYLWTNNTTGKTDSTEFTITQEQLEKAEVLGVTFTNEYYVNTVDRRATKKWYDQNGNEINWPEGLNVRLNIVTLDNGVAGTTVVKSILLDGVADNNGEPTAGTAFFEGLPKYKEDGNTLQQYAVVEATQFNGYTQDKEFYELPDSKAVTIQNTKCSTSVSVTKKWFGTVPQDATATICLWGYPQDGAVSDAKALATLAVTASENCESVTQTADGEEWTILFENVPVTNDLDVPLNYFFTELSCSPGYEPTYPSNGTSAPVDGIITNSMALTSFRVTKQWHNTANNLWPEGMEIALNVFRCRPDGSRDTSFSMPCSMTATGCQPTGGLPDGASLSFSEKANGRYQLTISGLEKYTPEGTLWKYFVTEDVPDGFDVVYSDENHSDVTSSGHAPNGGYILNTGSVYKLSVSKTVTGNFGDKRLYFTYTMTATNGDGTPYEGTLDYEKTGAITGDVVDKLSFKNGSATFTLCHNETITFAKMPTDMIYSVTENRSGAKGYTVQSSANGIPRMQSDSQYIWYGPICDSAGNALQDQRIAYVNDKSRIIPTGAEVSIGGSIALFLLFTLGLAVIMLRRRSDSDSE